MRAGVGRCSLSDFSARLPRQAQYGRVPHGSARLSLRTIDARRLRARAAQREISRALLARVREGYTFSDFRGALCGVCPLLPSGSGDFTPSHTTHCSARRAGRARRLEEAALPEAQLVGGAGDCAAPKLVAAAQRLNLRPTVRGVFLVAVLPMGCGSSLVVRPTPHAPSNLVILPP